MNDTAPESKHLTARLSEIEVPRAAWISLAIVGFFVVLSLFGVTNSSIGVEMLDSAPEAEDGVVLGSPRPIRSDEFLRTTPWRLGTTLSSPDAFQSPLTTDPSLAAATPNDGFVEYVVFLDATIVELLGPILPDTFLFAAYWWLPTIIVLLTLPLWLGHLGVRREIAWIATALVVLSPAVMWWSMWALLPLAWVLPASLLILWATAKATERGRLGVWSVIAAVVAGMFLARTALSYFPWALPLGAGILLPTILFALRKEQFWVRAAVSAIAAGSGLVALGAVMLENWTALGVLADTVFPGTRLSTAAALNPGFVFGAQHLGILRDDPQISTLNQSEISSIYTILIVPSVLLLVVLSRRAWSYARTWATVGSLVIILVVFLAWVSTDLPTAIGTALPGLNRVPPARLAQVIGVLVVILFAFVLDRYARFRDDDTSQPVVIAAAAGSTLLVSVWAGTLLRSSELNGLSLSSVWVVSFALAAAVGLAVWQPNRTVALVPLALGAAAIVLLANPMMVGLGGLRSGPAVDLIRAHTDQEAGVSRWSSDNLQSDAILMANGIPALSGQQWTGPAEDAWLILDPGRVYENEWNRGASYIVIAPTPGVAPSEIESPQADIIIVRVDPCDPALSQLSVDHMIASSPIESACLVPIGEFTLGGAARFAYTRVASG